MLRNLDIFQLETLSHTTRRVALANGGEAFPYSDLSVGRIEGFQRTIPALVSDGVTDGDNWYVVNLVDASNNMNRYVQTVAVLGATSADQARQWAFKNIGAFIGANDTWSTAITSTKALKAYLDRPSTSVAIIAIRQADLDTIAAQITDKPVVWDGSRLTSHDPSTLLHELVKHDDEVTMMDAMTPSDLPILMIEMGGEIAEYDALIVDYNRLDLLMQRLNTAMQKSSVGNVKPVNVTQSKPFKRNSVTNVAALFEMSDGQSVTIVFHSPDNTPAKLAPSDTLTSWKWMLNKRDISAAVSPKNGENVQMPDLAKRILTIVEKNSARFTRTNGNKAAQVQELADTNTRIGQKQEALAGILAINKDLQKQIDDAGKQPKADSKKDIPAITLGGESLSDLFKADIGNIWSQSPLYKKAQQDVGDAANAAAKVISSKDITAFSPYAETFSGVNDALIAAIDPFVMVSPIMYRRKIKIPKYMVTGDEPSHYIENGQTNFEDFRLSVIDKGDGSYVKVEYKDDYGRWWNLKNNAIEDRVFEPVAIKSMEIFNQYKASKTDMLSSDTEDSTVNRFAEHDTIAKQYGYSVDNSGVIFTPKGKDTGVKIDSPTGRLKISNAKEVLFSGANPAGLGKFLESYWYAEKTKAGVVPPIAAAKSTDDGRITPDTAGNMKNGDIVRTKDGTEFMSLGARHDWLEVAPMINGKPLVNSEDTFKFLLSPEKASAYPERRNEPIYQTGKNYYNDNKGQEPVVPVPTPTPAAKSTDLTEEELNVLRKERAEFDAKTDKIKAAKSREDAFKIATDLVTEMPEKEDQIRRAFSDAIRDNKWYGNEINFPKQPVKVNTDAEANRTLKRLQKALEGTAYSVNGKFNYGSAKLSIIYNNGGSSYNQKYVQKSIDKINGKFVVIHDVYTQDTVEFIKPLVDGMLSWLNGETVPKMFLGNDLKWDTQIGTPRVIDDAFKEAKAKAAPAEPVTQPEPTPVVPEPETTPATVQAEQPANEPSMTNPDRDYLQSIIDGKDMGLAPKEITAKMRTIITAAREAKDTVMMDLGDQAAKAYAAQTKAKAVAKLAEVQ